MPRLIRRHGAAVRKGKARRKNKRENEANEYHAAPFGRCSTHHTITSPDDCFLV